MTDVVPSKEDVAFWAKIAPDVPWAVHSHAYNGGASIHDLAKVDYRLGRLGPERREGTRASWAGGAR